MQVLSGYLFVFFGAGIGGALRHGVNSAALRIFGPGLGQGTLTVNILGSLLMGVLIEYLALRGGLGQSWRLFLATGVLGGFTTFSAFSLDAALLYERGNPGMALAYVLVSVTVSIAGLFAGLFIVRQLA